MIDFQQFHKILVTGPQRSGSRIASKVIAYDTRYSYIDEHTFKIDDVAQFNKVVVSSYKSVIQCPGMCYCIENYSANDILIVMMIRPIPDIIESEKRVEWINGPYHEYQKYGIERLQARKLRKHGDKISMRKYQYWKKHQKNEIKHFLELDYESLSYHHLWIPKEQRLHFTAEQTE